MKKAILIAAMLWSSINPLHAQPSVANASDIESADALPSVGMRYYYYPNLDAYFDTRSNMYIYEYKGVWTKSKELVSGLRGYSLLNSARVPIMDYNGDTPHTKLADHRKQFPKKYTSKRLPPKENRVVEVSER